MSVAGACTIYDRVFGARQHHTVSRPIESYAPEGIPDQLVVLENMLASNAAKKNDAQSVSEPGSGFSLNIDKHQFTPSMISCLGSATRRRNHGITVVCVVKTLTVNSASKISVHLMSMAKLSYTTTPAVRTLSA